MADTYFVSFVIRNDASYTARYKGLMDALMALSPTIWWAETTSFIIFASDLSIDAITIVIKDNINLLQDIAVVGKTDFKAMRVVGACKDEDIFKLVTFAKKS